MILIKKNRKIVDFIFHLSTKHTLYEEIGFFFKRYIWKLTNSLSFTLTNERNLKEEVNEYEDIYSCKSTYNLAIEFFFK